MVLDPADWNLAYCRKVFGNRVTPPFTVTWNAVTQGTDSFTGDGNVVGVANGLPPGPHTLTLTGDRAAVAAIRVDNPAGR